MVGMRTSGTHLHVPRGTKRQFFVDFSANPVGKGAMCLMSAFQHKNYFFQNFESSAISYFNLMQFGCIFINLSSFEFYGDLGDFWDSALIRHI